MRAWQRAQLPDEIRQLVLDDQRLRNEEAPQPARGRRLRRVAVGLLTGSIRLRLPNKHVDVTRPSAAGAGSDRAARRSCVRRWAGLAQNEEDTLRAIIQTGYGSADVMEPKELEKPGPGDGEVLVRVHAVSLAAGDYFGMRGTPFPIRFAVGFPRPKKDHVVGLDCAGIVEAVGPNVGHLRPGDEVYGECRGSCADYALAKEGGLAPKPVNLSFEQAAAVPTSACTALQALRDHGKVKPGQKVLINGASGGVGPFAVQIAKALGAEVTGVCSTRNVEMVRSIGADHVIDYSKEDFTRDGATT